MSNSKTISPSDSSAERQSPTNASAAVCDDAVREGLTFDDALRIARGCTDYLGGYTYPGAPLEAYQYGIQTVINALTEAAKRGLADSQIRALHRIGAPSPGHR